MCSFTVGAYSRGLLYGDSFNGSLVKGGQLKDLQCAFKKLQALTLAQQVAIHPTILPASVVHAAMSAKMAIAHSSATTLVSVLQLSTERETQINVILKLEM